MVIQHNISGMNANRQLNITLGEKAKSSEKLSSGYRINRAADDAAGLAISEKMRRQIKGLSQGTRNAQDGISWCQIADGSLNEVDDMLERVKELAVKAATDTLTDSDREYIDAEVQKISEEIDKIHSTTRFNEIPIFDGGLNPNNNFISNNGSIIITVPGGNTIEILTPFIGSEGKVGSVTESQAVGTENTSTKDTDFAKFVQQAAASAVSNLASNLPSLFSAASSDDIKIGLELGNIDGKSGTLAYAAMQIQSNSTSTTMSYTMKVDTSDYPVNAYSSMSAAQKADLAATIAHEMTHIIMDDTLTSGMLGGFPDWFIEGAAQTSSGDNGWVSHSIDQNSSDAQITGYMSKLKSMPYGAGYMATMVLGHLASGAGTVSSASIRSGLDKIMTDVANGKTFSDAISDNITQYTSLADFENGFTTGDATTLAAVKMILQARGSNGAGSIFGNLSDSEEDLFGNVAGSTTTNYQVLTDNTKYANAFGSGYSFDNIPSGGGTNAAALLYLQVGADNTNEDRIPLLRYSVSVQQITNSAGFDTKTAISSRNTLDVVKIAATNISKIRSYYGALQNRLEHTVKNQDNVVENTTASESLIRDTDMAAEIVKFSNDNVLAQAGQAMLAQANMTNEGVMALLK